VTEALSPIAQGTVADDDVVRRIADVRGKSQAQLYPYAAMCSGAEAMAVSANPGLPAS